jgi:hypothetical protein
MLVRINVNLKLIEYNAMKLELKQKDIIATKIKMRNPKL